MVMYSPLVVWMVAPVVRPICCPGTSAKSNLCRMMPSAAGKASTRKSAGASYETNGHENKEVRACHCLQQSELVAHALARPAGEGDVLVVGIAFVGNGLIQAVRL